MESFPKKNYEFTPNIINSISYKEWFNYNGKNSINEEKKPTEGMTCERRGKESVTTIKKGKESE
ncbi:MAG: hypothetical protein JXA54_02575 [Candidatus Heimdallarchaeota archaeon]|nr:hypothetical protein [Candidatus Heimdallarchaeota archaeon]